MKRLLHTAILVCLFAVPQPPPLGAQFSASQSSEVIAAERGCIKAFIDADFAAVDRYIADDFIGILPEAAAAGASQWLTRTKAEWLDSLRTHNIRYESVDLYNEKVFMHGD